MKTIKSFCRPGNIKYFDTDIEILVPSEYKEKDVETRAVWVSTVANIDIPRISSVEQYKEYLSSIIATVKEYNMNTVVFQVRPTNDALYESELAPWSKFITGEQGKYPGFDVFGYFMEEAKKANVAVHAWINPYRVSGDKLDELNMTKEEYVQTLAPNNFARLHPDHVIETSLHKLILDPASDLVKEYISDVCVEIATKYDVKALHIDDYFYPYEPIADKDEDEKFKKSGFEKLSDFRRNNVDLCIELIHKKLSKLDRKVEFGISPFAIHRTHINKFENKDDEAAWIDGSNNHASCFSGYKSLYADVIKWMEEGWIDYVIPQDYFDMENIVIDKEGNEKCQVRYADVVMWWSKMAAKTNVKLYIGQAIYRYSEEGSWSNPEEIPNQLLYNQMFDNVLGTCFFTYHDFTRDRNKALVEGRKLLKKMWTKPAQEI